MVDITLVIPVYNNEATLELLYQKVTEVLAPTALSTEFVFVNDTSTDRSAEILLAMKQAHDNIRLVEMQVNSGQSVALIVGLSVATGTMSVCMDADLQDPPDAVLRLISAYQNNQVAVVFAGRAGNYESQGRHATASVFKKIFSILTGGKIPPEAGLFFLIRTAAAQPFIRYAGSRPYLLALIHKEKLTCAAIPVVRNRRPGGGSGYTSLKRWKIGWRAIQSLYRIRPKSLEPSHFSEKK